MKKTQRSLQIDKFIQENQNLSNADLATALMNKFGEKYSPSGVRVKRHRALNKVSSKKKETTINQDVEQYDFRKELSGHNKKYKELLAENIKLREALDSMKTITASKSTHTIKPVLKSEQSEATAIIVASDWHSCETVIPSTVNYLNEYNQTIARKRANEFFVNALRLVKIFSQDIEIKNVVCGLLGDFINNMIHEEAQETNSLMPTHEALFAQDLIISGIEYWLANSNYDFTFVCHSGNHARSSVKQRHGIGDSGYSFEYLMYHAIANRFYGNKRVNFVIPDSYHSYVTVYDMTVRFHHGHDIRYGGGVGGITIPVNKAIAQWNKARRADIDVFGHFHSFFDGGNFICNGSMVGWNSYAIAIKASFEKPKQALFLIDKNRGKTIVCPILFDN